jgi:hypothetical protein
MINPFTQQQIADITGQTSVNVTRLNDSSRKGFLCVDHHNSHTYIAPLQRLKAGAFKPRVAE